MNRRDTNPGGEQVQDDPNLKFVQVMANPHSWLLTADNLHEQALALYERRGRSSLTSIDGGGNGDRKTWDGVTKSVFLLGGFALENAIKAFLVYENPEWISNGRLSRKLCSHRLTSLQKQSKLIPFKRQYVWVLEQFEEGLDTWARYPCGFTAGSSTHQRSMQHVLWSGYTILMQAHGKRLQALLEKQWHGPHGFRGRWTFQGEFLSTVSSSPAASRR
jgi:hypothetical protein